MRWHATFTATTREVVYYTGPLLPRLRKRFPGLANFPPLGRSLLVAANVALLLSLIFYGWDLHDKHAWEPIAIRTGWMTVCQIPLIFLLAGKRNMVGYATGTSYERLNWIHRWVARCMFLTATIHLSYFLRSWAKYDYIGQKLKIDIISRRGVGAWCVLLWITISSFAPIRGWSYEFFVVQHLVSIAGFVTIVMLHTPPEAHIYVWLPVAIFFLDRLLRFGFVLYNNLTVFHLKRRRTSGAGSTVFTCAATFQELSCRATKVSVPNPPFTWRPGQHAFVSCHSLVPLQSHPFTISSLPTDGALEFVIRSRSGGTKKLFSHASGALPAMKVSCKSLIVDGPYGRVRELEQFDSVFLLAGGAGATFVVPLLRDLVRLRRDFRPMVTRKVRLVWVVKSRGQISWFARELAEAVEQSPADLSLEVSVYVTCDDTLTLMASQPAAADQNPTCDLPGSPVSTTKDMVTVQEKELCGGNCCCCQDVLEDEDAIVEASKPNTRKTCCSCTTPITPPMTPATTASPPPLPLPSPPKAQELLSATTTVSSSASSICLLPDTIAVLAGRPAIRTLINKELEKARGESGVVVCGPSELIECTRQAVVGLSDERAVHKGTGAQGVSPFLLPFEAFGKGGMEWGANGCGVDIFTY